jgi:magnesium chelatase subunit H
MLLCISLSIGRNVFAYGRNEGNGEGVKGTARPAVLDKLLASTERVVQEIDSVCPI